jgi:transcription elongation factor Elf1
MKNKCPKCSSENIGAVENKENGQVIQCNDCGMDWFEEYLEYVKK